ncbi:MAG TPA: deoxyribonuclease V [Candidatus Acidoferrales bacterium]|nr:deoxyribonuclease V [Candidatus Acidoferrales bacterium]
MKAREFHRWDVTPAEARRIQVELRGCVELQDRFATEARRHRGIRKSKLEKRKLEFENRDSKLDIRNSVRTVAGADVAFDFRAGGTRAGRAIAGVIVYSFPEMKELERACAERELKFPYVPGLLSFREIPALLAAFAKLSAAPEVVFCDGQGYSHPRRFGLASHLGVLLDCVTVGCAKSRLIGEHAEPARAAGSWKPLMDVGETIGAVLRTRDRVNPIYVSQGHRVSLPTAIALVMAVADGFRVPKPTREADHFVEEMKRRSRACG